MSTRSQRRKDAASPAQRREMRRLYDAGKTLREIASSTGFSHGGVSNYLHQDGGTIRPQGLRPGTKRRKVKR